MTPTQFNPEPLSKERAFGASLEPPEPDGATFSWSWSEDDLFSGQFDSREAAIAEAEAENFDQHATVYTARNGSVAAILQQQAELIGERVHDDLTDRLYEEVGEVVELFTLTAEQQASIGHAIIAQCIGFGGFRCWAVRDVQAHEIAADSMEVPQ